MNQEKTSESKDFKPKLSKSLIPTFDLDALARNLSDFNSWFISKPFFTQNSRKRNLEIFLKYWGIGREQVPIESIMSEHDLSDHRIRYILMICRREVVKYLKNHDE